MKFLLPAWLRKETIKLPPWAKVASVHPSNVHLLINVDTNGYVEEWLKLLGDVQPDQYWLEVAYQCAKLDVQSCLVGTEYDPRASGKPVEFHFSRADQWAQRKFPVGKKLKKKVNGVEKTLAGAELATTGREARDHYVRIRGRLPF